MIEVKNVTKKYGSFIAVDNINFKIEKGEVLGFLGPNGAREKYYNEYDNRFY